MFRIDSPFMFNIFYVFKIYIFDVTRIHENATYYNTRKLSKIFSHNYRSVVTNYKRTKCSSQIVHGYIKNVQDVFVFAKSTI